ncbi:PH domain-containing protein [Lentilactobacillus hilgardii]|uniref:PH domain-containing protein n=1 Tax=Lentilactobacillus hilgardii TaxID=1588 RepID=A0A6P1EAC0_LENHI|nr:PH domain-containing protein [Lentilactobacillus hilgardii]MCI2020047.1 PH domain-containing protein [Lentilactobacillus buchneri]RRG12082.1 MAG: hypothetical protein DUD35_02400 [Lactobacillus sp.]EEI71968.1 hypothetical protein HMPREF0496_0732 [Lentilactobacillus hilgardii ATCC 27305]MCT3391031.1 hypothetical protein [Lentilactobacillus hilgardii]QHB51104.1 PH domain-containing protein [Lentilactobacillus hilgardii]
MTEGTHLPEKIKNVWRISAFINFAVLLIIAIGCYIAFIFFNWQWLFWPGIGFGAIAIIDLIFELILVSYRYAFWRYNLTADAVELQSGYIFKKLVSIPIARVQDVTLSAGPILQSQKLQTVQITTASTSHKIDGLEPQTAEQLRRQIMQLAVEVKENDV